jgi:hypothetical protein
MRDKGNFLELISILKDDISYYKNAIQSGEAKPNRHSELKAVISISMIDICQALYSNGASKEDVKKAVLECIPAFENGFIFDNGFGDYDQMIWLISLAILCDIDLNDFKKITAILQRDGANDKLLSKLIMYKQTDWEESTKEVIQQSPYAKALIINTANDIKNYLDKVWYEGHSDAAWHDTHLNKKVNCYAGYWAWEAAALAKVNGIDDSALKNQKYFPYDAVHW